jgi:hypothetical protein
VALFASVSTYAQGTINFANKISGSVDAKIIAGATGLGASGANGFFAQLYVGAAAGSLVAAGSPIALRSDAGIGYVVASIVTTVLPAGSTAIVQMRAWTGAATYELASIKNSSADVSVVLGGQGPSGPPAVPANLVGLQGFTVAGVVPEPATLALAGIGGLGLLAMRRKSA